MGAFLASLLRWILATMLIGAVALAGIALYAYQGAISLIKTKTLLAASYYGLPPVFVSAVVLLLSVVAFPVFIGIGKNLLLGRAKTWLTVCAALLGSATGYLWITSTWLFDTSGRPIVRLCPPAPGISQLRVQHHAADHLLGGECPFITPETSTVVLAMRSNLVPRELAVSTVSAFDSLAFFRPNGSAAVYVGAPLLADGTVRLYDNPGFDPKTGALLTRAGSSVLAAHRSMLVKVEAERAAALKAQAEAQLQEKLAEDRRIAQAIELARLTEEKARNDELRAQAEAQRAKEAAEQAARAEQDREARLKAQAARRAEEAERVAQARRDAPLQFFNGASFDSDAPLVLMADSHGYTHQALQQIGRISRYYHGHAVRPEFYEHVNMSDVSDGRNLNALAAIPWAPGIRIVYIGYTQCEYDPQYGVKRRVIRWVRYDTAARHATLHAEYLAS